MENDLHNYWAKDTGETLILHSLRVADVAKLICYILPLPSDERNKLAMSVSEIGLLHDIGKAATGFQQMVRNKSRWGHRHEILSAAVAAKIAPHLTVEELLAIVTHHKSIPQKSEGTTFEECLPDNELPFIRPNVFDEMIAEITNEREYFLEFLNNLNDKRTYKWHIDNLDFCFKDIGILKHYWLRRQTNGQKDKTTVDQRRHASLLRGLLITADHIASAHQFNIPEIPFQKDYEALIHRHELKGQNILPFQQMCAETKGDAILKAPTGSGKTAAILLWAAKNQSENGRLFYVLPHTASINAMHQRLQKIYCKDTVGVLHYKNAAYLFRVFENDYASTDAAKMAHTISGLARELYHPIRVTTPHQILRAALQGKGWELGLAEFPNGCFVFDEIHAFEPLLVGLTIATVKWLKAMGAKVLFASATLPLFLEDILKNEIGISNKNILSPNPENQKDKDILDKIRHRIEIRPESLLSNIQGIISELRTSSKTALIVCNHVATSQQIFKELRKEFDNTRLLHARFNAKDRMDIETEIQGRTPPRILVATQAVEVSLDLDYDCGYIEPAPADALGQRLGRINRKGSRNELAQVVIFEEPSAKIGENPMYLPYDKEVTQETVNLLRQVEFLTEQQLTNIVNKIYVGGYKGDSKENYEKGLNNQTIVDFDESIIAGTYREWVEAVIEGTDGQIEVLPMGLYNRFIELREEKRYLEASQLLVPIRLAQKFAALKRGVLQYNKDINEWIIYLDYSDIKGLDLASQIENIL